MGRQKQNKPRRERHGRVHDLAGMLDLPTAMSAGESVTLDVVGVGFAGDGYATDDKPAFVRLADGSVKLLPETLRAWARRAIDTDSARRSGGEGSIFPSRVEFGIVDGEARAELCSS